MSSYRSDRIEIRPAQRQLLVDGQPVSLGARAFDLLVALVERRDRVVSKGDLLDLVWPGLIVEENNLQVQVSGLRKLLGPKAIATIPGRGYRFVAEPDVPTQVEATADLGGAPASSGLKLSTNLPAGLRALIGREADLAALDLLLIERRLVSIVGTGGLGKTRLAQAAAHGQVGRPRDGVWWVELAAQKDSLQVTTAVAAAAAVSIDRAKIPARLCSVDLLLVLDNCEQVIADVADLLSNALVVAPSVRWMTTSIEPLRLADECVYHLTALAIPPTDAPLQRAIGFGALKLFAVRARDADRKFAVTEENVSVAIDICRQLDGVPLAIEMAAARVRQLGLIGVRDHLKDRLHVLRSERDAPARQQTLRATLDWSYALLCRMRENYCVASPFLPTGSRSTSRRPSQATWSSTSWPSWTL